MLQRVDSVLSMSAVMAYSAMPNFTWESKKENKLDVHKCNFLKKALVLKNVIILNYIFLSILKELFGFVLIITSSNFLIMCLSHRLFN